MPGLKDINRNEDGIVNYDGYRFPVLRNVTCQVSPVYDEIGRAVIARDLIFTVHAILHQNASSQFAFDLDDTLAKLSKAGGRLIISDVGLLDDIDTGDPASKGDSNFGPKVQVISVVPVGAGLAWEIVWVVTYRPALALNDGDVLSANWDAEFSCDENGLVTRSISGFVEMVRSVKISGGKKVIDVGKADESFLGKIKVAEIPWMRRVSSRRRHNAAKNRVDFSFVDTEFADGAYPDGMTHAESELTIENNPPGFVNWTAALSASFTVAPGLPKSIAATRWFLMLFDAAAKAREAVKSAKGVVIPERFRVTVPKFGRTCRFAASWRMVACLHDIMTKSGLWEPVPGTDYKSWQASMNAAGVNNLDGVSRLRLYGSETIIEVNDTAVKEIPIGTKGLKPDRVSPFEGKLLCPEVTEEASYLSWENRIRGAQEQNAVIHRPMQKVASIAGVLAGGGTPSAIAAGVISYFLQPETGLKQDVIQKTGKTDNYIIMSGKSLRLKWSPEIPVLKKVAGADVEELARNVETRPLTGFFDCVLIAARWTILYRVKDQIYGVKPPSNRHICFTEGENDGHGGQAAAKK